MSLQQYLKGVVCFIILTDLTSFLLSFVLWSFQVLGEVSMYYEIRSGKTLSLGMPMSPQGNIKRQRSIKNAPEGILSFVYNPSVNYLKLYFYSSHDRSFAWSVMYYMSLCFVWFLVCHNHLCWTHVFDRDTHYSWFVRILSLLGKSLAVARVFGVLVARVPALLIRRYC